MNKPGQGFVLGQPITFVAIPHPVGAGYIDMLIKAGRIVADARIEVERISEGNTPAKDAAVDSYVAAVEELESIEALIRQNCGEVLTRPRFVSTSELKGK